MMIHKKLTIFVPGRLCLFGEHSDWAGLYQVINANIVSGAAIVTGIEQGISAAVERADRFSMHKREQRIPSRCGRLDQACAFGVCTL
jgi:galactokinase